MKQVLSIALKAHIKCSDFQIADNLRFILAQRGIESRVEYDVVIVDARHAALAKRLRKTAW